MWGCCQQLYGRCPRKDKYNQLLQRNGPWGSGCHGDTVVVGVIVTNIYSNLFHSYVPGTV